MRSSGVGVVLDLDLENYFRILDKRIAYNLNIAGQICMYFTRYL